MLTFRIAITATVMAFITVLAACLIFIQVATYRAATAAAAAAAMDAASTNTLNRLEAEVSAVDTSFASWHQIPLSPTRMTGARSVPQLLFSKLRCTNCRRQTASMSATTTGVGCKSGASMSSAQRNAGGWGHRPAGPQS